MITYLPSTAPTQCGNCHLSSNIEAVASNVCYIGSGKYTGYICFYTAAATSFAISDTIRSPSG